MKDINLSDETIIRLYKNASIGVRSERTGEPLAIILPAPDASAVEFTEVVRRAITSPPAVLCPDGEVIGRDESAEKIDAIRRVLSQRIERNNSNIIEQRNKGNFSGATYCRGKTAAYYDVIELLGESIMYIEQELNTEE